MSESTDFQADGSIGLVCPETLSEAIDRCWLEAGSPKYITHNGVVIGRWVMSDE